MFIPCTINSQVFAVNGRFESTLKLSISDSIDIGFSPICHSSRSDFSKLNTSVFAKSFVFILHIKKAVESFINQIKSH